MLDYNRIIGLATNLQHRKHNKLKNTLVEFFTTTLESNDLVFVNDKTCVGPGEAVGAIANAKFPIEEFGDLARDVFKVMMNLKTDAKKDMIIIVDEIPEKFEYTVNKMIAINGATLFPVHVTVFVLGNARMKVPESDKVRYFKLPHIEKFAEKMGIKDG